MPKNWQQDVMIHLSDATDFSFIYLANNNETYLLIFFSLNFKSILRAA